MLLKSGNPADLIPGLPETGQLCPPLPSFLGLDENTKNPGGFPAPTDALIKALCFYCDIWSLPS